MSKRILIVEDESSIREILYEFLTESGYIVDQAEDGLVGLRCFNSRPYDLIITDVMMPKMDGFELVEKIRASSTVPIIVLTALSSEDSQIKAYDIAADDYVTKPFSPVILVKKIESLFRRLGIKKTNSDIVKLGDIEVDRNNWTVNIHGKVHDFSVKEFDLFYALVKHEGEVLSREWLLKNIWGYDFIGDTRVIDSQIKNIRKKIGNNIIETVHGVGYKIVSGGLITE